MHGASSRRKARPVSTLPAAGAEWVQPLERRWLMAAVYPSASEQYLLELVNRARANPAAEAARMGVSLNEGLPSGTISAAAKQPLAWNPNLGDAARRHTQWMFDHDTFTHNEGSATPIAQMRAAGYAFTGSWWAGQNIWWYGYTPPKQPPLTATVEKIHHDLFVDAGVAGRAHRENILKDSYKEIGTGVLTGVHRSGGYTYNSVGVTEDFAVRNRGQSGAFLTGVAYRDSNSDHFCTPGEGLGGVAVKAVRNSDKKVFTTSTWAAGGYTLKLPAGTYHVTASGGAFAAATPPVTVIIRSTNVKADFDPRIGAATFGAARASAPAFTASLSNVATTPTPKRIPVAASGGVVSLILL